MHAQVVDDPKYYGLLGLRDATLTDQANIDVVALPGTIQQWRQTTSMTIMSMT